MHLELLYCPYGVGNGLEKPFRSNLTMTSLERALKKGSSAEDGYLADTKRRTVIIRGVLSVTVISAEDLPSADLMGKADPFVVLTMKKSGTRNKTRVRLYLVIARWAGWERWIKLGMG